MMLDAVQFMELVSFDCIDFIVNIVQIIQVYFKWFF